MVEYSELSKEMAEATGADGNLLYLAGHICVNLFHIDFLRKAGVEFPTKYLLTVYLIQISHCQEEDILCQRKWRECCSHEREWDEV